jgi:Flp pilus assembly protein TadG
VIRGVRGSVTVEVAVLAPVLLLVVFTIVQVGLWSYARSLALGAAQEGVAAGRAYRAPADAGRLRAEQFLARAAGDSLLDAHVVARTTPGSLQVEVTGRALSVLPGIPGLPVRQHAQGPIERVTQP